MYLRKQVREGILEAAFLFSVPCCCPSQILTVPGEVASGAWGEGESELPRGAALRRAVRRGFLGSAARGGSLR